MVKKVLLQTQPLRFIGSLLSRPAALAMGRAIRKPSIPDSPFSQPAYVPRKNYSAVGAPDRIVLAFPKVDVAGSIPVGLNDSDGELSRSALNDGRHLSE